MQAVIPQNHNLNEPSFNHVINLLGQRAVNYFFSESSAIAAKIAAEKFPELNAKFVAEFAVEKIKIDNTLSRARWNGFSSAFLATGMAGGVVAACAALIPSKKEKDNDLQACIVAVTLMFALGIGCISGELSVNKKLVELIN